MSGVAPTPATGEGAKTITTMKLRFTKMHGAGNDFVVLDATAQPLDLSREQLQRLGDRHRGVGADQILVVEASHESGVDFGYRIYNGASGGEVEHCGNGARCFVRYVRDKGLTQKTSVRVRTVNNLLTLTEQTDGRITVNMNRPFFDHPSLPFDAMGLTPRELNGWPLYPIEGAEFGVLSMGNPHAVTRVDDVTTAPVATLGPRVETHPCFARKVNVGFMQVVSRGEIRLRVWERDAGETLACGTGACAAVVAGVRAGWLDAQVNVHTHGGLLTIEWASGESPVLMTGPAVTVFEGEIEL
jgi:diaminopimelate epimerase